MDSFQANIQRTGSANVARYQDGCDMILLRHHFVGEGNSTRCIADAKRIQNLLHFQREHCPFISSRLPPYSVTEHSNVEELLMKVQNATLETAVAELGYQLNIEGIFCFTVAVNHLKSLADVCLSIGQKEKRLWY